MFKRKHETLGGRSGGVGREEELEGSDLSRFDQNTLYGGIKLSNNKKY